MKMTDFETRRDLKDVEIELTREEAEEMLDYLRCLLSSRGVPRIYLTQLHGQAVERELSVVLAP